MPGDEQAQHVEDPGPKGDAPAVPQQTALAGIETERSECVHRVWRVHDRLTGPRERDPRWAAAGL